MFLQWRSPEDYATNAAIVLLTLAGLTIIMIDHQTKSRQKRLAAALTLGYWKFSPAQVDDTKQRKLNWMKLFLAGLMIACTAMSITVKFLKITRALTLSVTIMVGWVTFLAFALNVNVISAEEKKRNKERADSKEDTELIGWRAKLKGVTLEEDRRLPVTIVTGFLGSGKTTLVKKVLDNTVGIKVLVIENEIGAEGIDHDLLLQHTAKEEIILMNNGCICCSVRKDLITTFHNMFADSSFAQLDWVMIETTGLADPAPLIQSLYMDQQCSKYLRLDSVLTVVDAKHLPEHIGKKEKGEMKNEKVGNARDGQGSKKEDFEKGERSGVHGGLPEAVMQIIFSDRIILNKTDLVSKEALLNIQTAVRELNPSSQIICCEFSNVPVQDLLNIRAFDPSRNAALITPRSDITENSEKLDDENQTKSVNSADSGNTVISGINIKKNVAKTGFIQYDKNGKIINSKIKKNETDGNPTSTDADSVSTVSLVTDKPLDLDMFNLWVSSLLRVEGANIFRLKGILNMFGYDNQFVVQGVHMIFDGEIGPKWDDSGSQKVELNSSLEISNASANKNENSAVKIGRKSRLVLIGKGLNSKSLRVGFLACEHPDEDDEN